MLSLRLVRRFGNVSRARATSALESSVDKAGSFTNSHREPRKLDEPALEKIKKERDPEKLFSLFKANACNRVVVENKFAFEDMVSRLAGAGRFDYIENILEHQKILPQGRREGFVVRIIMLYGKARMTKHAVDTFCDMHLYGCERTVKSFNATLKVVAQSRDIKFIESFFNDFSFRFGIDLDVYSLNIVINAFCDMGMLNKAYLVLVEIEKLGITPDVITYTTLISASYKENKPEIAQGLWNLMILQGCRPNIATFNVRIQYLVSKGRAHTANRLLAFMRRHKKFLEFPDEVTYNLVIKGFFRAGYHKMAMRVYSALLGDGYKPNQKIYETMIHYLCEAGQFNLAYTMCKDSIQKNWFPSVHTINNLLEGLRKDGKFCDLGKARYIYGLAQKRVPPFSDTQLKGMKSILSSN